MPDPQRRWPGYRQDGEDDRKRQERDRELQILADNLSARIRASDPVQRDRIDRSTGRTFGDGEARGMYHDSAARNYRDVMDRFRGERRSYRERQVRAQGRAGRN